MTADLFMGIFGCQSFRNSCWISFGMIGLGSLCCRSEGCFGCSWRSWWPPFYSN